MHTAPVANIFEGGGEGRGGGGHLARVAQTVSMIRQRVRAADMAKIPAGGLRGAASPSVGSGIQTHLNQQIAYA